MKEYLFKKDSYWTSNGCDCCEADETVFYVCTSHPGEIDNGLSEEECTMDAILHSSGSRQSDWSLLEMLYDLDIVELNRLAKDLGVTVTITDCDPEA